MPIGDIAAKRDYFYWLRRWANYMSAQTVCTRFLMNETTGDEWYYRDIGNVLR